MEQPQNVTAHIGDFVILTCKYNVNVDCAWSRNGSRGQPYSNSKRGINGIIYNTTDCPLTIPAVKASEFTQWQCYTLGKNATRSNHAWISEIQKPWNPVIELNNSIIQSNFIKLSCEQPLIAKITCVSKYGNPAPHLRWELNGKRFNGSIETLTNGENNYTTILTWDWESPMDYGNNYALKCCLQHPGVKEVSTTTLNIKSDTFTAKPIIWLNGQEIQNIDFDSKMIATPLENVTCSWPCCAGSRFTPKLYWKLGDQEFNGSSKNAVSDSKVTIAWDQIINWTSITSGAILECVVSSYSIKLSAAIIIRPFPDENEIHVSRTSLIMIIICVSIAFAIAACISIYTFIKKKKKSDSKSANECSVPDKDEVIYDTLDLPESRIAEIKNCANKNTEYMEIEFKYSSE